MEVPAAWDVVEPRVTHNSCATLEQWARSDCLIMFLDGTGEPFFKSSPSGCSSFHRRVRPVNGRGGVLPGVKQTVPKSEIYAGIQALRHAPRKNPLVLISDLSISCPRPRKGGRIEWVSDVQFGNQYWDAVENHSAAIPILKVKSQRVVAVVRASANLDVRVERVCRQTGGQRGRNAPAL